VTSALHPREIWLASYKVDETETTTPDRHRLVALKFVPPTTSGGSSKDVGGSQDKLRAELRRQAQFSHPNVAAFIGVAWSPQTHLVAVTEYLEQGDLRQWLHRTNRTTEAEDGQVFGPGIWSVAKLQMLVDLARALVYLHSMHPPVAHGNCNSRNVLLTPELRAKWSDFGNAAGEVLSERDRLAYSAVGSGRWISPEALLGRETVATPKGSRDAGDVYSFGVLMAEIDSHTLPFSDLMRANRSALPETDILQLIAQGALSPTLSETCAPAIVELVAGCTQYAPAQRPSSKQVLARLQRALQEARDAAARQKAARVAPSSVVESGEVQSGASSGGVVGGGEQYYYYAGDESKALPSFV
jgi:serine/threonine protein kinase